MAEIVNHALDAPVANILIVAGLAFLAIGVIGKISGKIEPGTGGRVMAGVLGIALLAYGLNAHSSSDAPDGVSGSETEETTEPTPPRPPDNSPDDPPEPAGILVPDFEGRPYTEATGTLERAGLSVTLRTEDPGAADLARGIVLRTEPRAGSTVSAGTDIVLVVSSGSEPDPAPPADEDCLAFRTAGVSLSRDGSAWLLTDGTSRMKTFDVEQEGEQALGIIRNYGMDSRCFVGRPDPSIEYWLAGGRAPEGAMRGEDCIAFNPETLDLIESGGTWFLANGRSRMMAFPDENEGREGRAIIRRWGFTQMCYVGRPNASFTYFRR